MLKNLHGPEKSVIFTHVKGNKKKTSPDGLIEPQFKSGGTFFHTLPSVGGFAVALGGSRGHSRSPRPIIALLQWQRLVCMTLLGCVDYLLPLSAFVPIFSRADWRPFVLGGWGAFPLSYPSHWWRWAFPILWWRFHQVRRLGARRWYFNILYTS